MNQDDKQIASAFEEAMKTKNPLEEFMKRLTTKKEFTRQVAPKRTREDPKTKNKRKIQAKSRKVNRGK